MGDLSKNLSRYEMACRCGCGFDTVDIELVEVMQALCDYYADDTGHPVVLLVTGPNRCVEHNAAEGGKPDSQHRKARAVDFEIKIMGERILPLDVYNYLDAKYPNEYGIGLYRTFVHFDTRTNGRARWGKEEERQ